MIQANGQAAQRFLGPPRTADYKPSLVAPLPLWSGHDTTWYSWFDVEWMRRDPQCQFGLRILRAPLATVTWEIPASAPEVAAWVDRTLRKVWTRYLNKVTAYLEYGSCGGETTWRYDRSSDLIELNELLDLHVLDMKPLQQSRKQVGVRVKSSLGDMAPADLFAPRYWWIANEPEFGAYHGRARLAGAWIPWQEKTARHGARDVRRTWYVKCVMDGGTLYVPPGTTEVDVGVNKANVDYGRELMEKSLAGGVKVFPNVTDEKGKRLWEYEPPKINGELTGIHTLMEELDVEIIVGMGIPPEVVQAADTGSGWSGRSVPFLVFLTSEDQLADTTVQAIDKHILRPGVAVNFGEDARYEIRLKSLVKQAEEEEAKKQGQALGATAAQGQEGGQQKPGPGGPKAGQPQTPGQPKPAPPVRLSIQHAPPGGVSIGGQDFKGGEFIPGDVLAKATKKEKKELNESAYQEKVAKLRAKLGEERITKVKDIVARLLPDYQHIDLYGQKVKASHPAVPETVLVRELMKQGLSNPKGTGLKAYNILDAMVTIGELARHETGAGDPVLPRKKAVSYSLPQQRLSIQHAPAGYTKDNPLRIGGQEFTGGEFIPEDVLARATPEEKAKLARIDKVRLALEKLAGRGAARKPPFELTDPYEPSPYAGPAFGEARDKEWPIQDVPVKDLIARQDTITKPDVLRHAATPEAERKPILLVKKDGKLYIHDGTNRAAAAKLAGDKTIKAKVIDLDQ